MCVILLREVFNVTISEAYVGVGFLPAIIALLWYHTGRGMWGKSAVAYLNNIDPLGVAKPVRFSPFPTPGIFSPAPTLAPAPMKSTVGF